MILKQLFLFISGNPIVVHELFNTYRVKEANLILGSDIWDNFVDFSTGSGIVCFEKEKSQ